MTVNNLTVAVVAASLLAAGPALAEIKETTLKIVGLPIQNVLFTKGEKPFLTETLPEMSGGKVKVELVSADTLGLKGPEIIRLIGTGAMTFGSGGLTQAVADSPVFEACDLPGLSGSVAEARKTCDAYKPEIAAVLKEKFGVKLMALGANPPQVVWCAKPLSGLGDIKGKKVRVFNQVLADFVNGVGGTPVNIPYNDTVPALQNGVVDCAVTGSLTGNTSKWFEVTSHLYPLSLGWAIQYWAVNEEAWNKFDPEMQTFLTKAYDKLEDRIWKIAQEATDQGIACNRGDATCTLGIKARMTIVDIGAGDEKVRKEILNGEVVPQWAKRCGSACATKWNVLVGKDKGLMAPTGS